MSEALQIDLVRFDRAVPTAGRVGSRKPCPSPSAQRAAAQIPEASSAQQHRPAIACWALSLGSRGAGRSEDHKAGDADPLAPCRLPSLLALEIPLSLPLIKSGYIDGAIHRGRAVGGCVLLHAQGAQQESPLPAIGGFGQCCNNPCRIAANAAGAARRIQQHGRDIPGGWSRSGAPHSRARANRSRHPGSRQLGELLGAVGNTILEIIPLSLRRARSATGTLRRMRLDRQCTTGLRKPRADRDFCV